MDSFLHRGNSRKSMMSGKCATRRQRLRHYRKTHDHLPRLQPEIDDALLMVFKRVSNVPANTTVVPQSVGTYRVYYNLRMKFDQSIRAIPYINGQIQFPGSWTAPAGNVVIVTDGENQFMIWRAGMDGHPSLDPETNTPLVINETVDPQGS